MTPSTAFSILALSMATVLPASAQTADPEIGRSDPFADLPTGGAAPPMAPVGTGQPAVPDVLPSPEASPAALPAPSSEAAGKAAAAAMPEGPVAGGRPKGWQTWTWDGNCFAFAYPKRENVAAIDRDGAYIAIKHMPAEKTFNSIAIVSGRGDDDGVSGSIEIEGQVFNLLMFAGTGFVSTGPREDRLMDAMLKGGEAKVHWVSNDGLVSQTYQLDGIVEAKKTVDFACKVPQRTATAG
jgi:hypothetical protein